jgi:hypothetical protein
MEQHICYENQTDKKTRQHMMSAHVNNFQLRAQVTDMG